MMLERVFFVLIMARMIGYVLTYGAFGTDPPTPFGVEGLNSQIGAIYRTLRSI